MPRATDPQALDRYKEYATPGATERRSRATLRRGQELHVFSSIDSLQRMAEGLRLNAASSRQTEKGWSGAEGKRAARRPVCRASHLLRVREKKLHFIAILRHPLRKPRRLRKHGVPRPLRRVARASFCCSRSCAYCLSRSSLRVSHAASRRASSAAFRRAVSRLW